MSKDSKKSELHPTMFGFLFWVCSKRSIYIVSIITIFVLMGTAFCFACSEGIVDWYGVDPDRFLWPSTVLGMLSISLVSFLIASWRLDFYSQRRSDDTD